MASGINRSRKPVGGLLPERGSHREDRGTRTRAAQASAKPVGSGTELAGRIVAWDAQPRGDRSVGLAEAFQRHAGHVILGLAMATAQSDPDDTADSEPVSAGSGHRRCRLTSIELSGNFRRSFAKGWPK
jgi:hypothetical protein